MSIESINSKKIFLDVFIVERYALLKLFKTVFPIGNGIKNKKRDQNS